MPDTHRLTGYCSSCDRFWENDLAVCRREHPQTQPVCCPDAPCPDCFGEALDSGGFVDLFDGHVSMEKALDGLGDQLRLGRKAADTAAPQRRKEDV